MGVNIKYGNKLLKLLDLPNKMKDMRPAFREIAALELSQTKQRFLKEIDPEGKRWDIPFTIRRGGNGQVNTAFNNPWSYVMASNYKATPPGYRFWRRPDKILRDTGTLFNSLGSGYTNTYAIVGTNLEYASKHQEGNGVKARPFLGINKTTQQNVNKVMINFLK